MKREFDKTERRQRNQIKRSNKAILGKKVLSFVLSGVQPFRFFVFVFAENSVMKQNRWGPLIC